MIVVGRGWCLGFDRSCFNQSCAFLRCPRIRGVHEGRVVDAFFDSTQTACTCGGRTWVVENSKAKFIILDLLVFEFSELNSLPRIFHVLVAFPFLKELTIFWSIEWLSLNNVRATMQQLWHFLWFYYSLSFSALLANS